jgi:hypothetical protein
MMMISQTEKISTSGPYPVEFKMFSQNSEHASFRGYLMDVSISGACSLKISMEDSI